MQKLGLLDHAFYKADQYDVISMVMGGASIVAPARKSQPLDAAVIADHLAARLEKVSLMRSKFIQDPLRLGSVQRIEDPAFDIRKHIDISSVSSPGGYQQLSSRIEELCSEHLSVDQVWKWTVLGGLAGGRVAIFCRIHHALADGIGASEALTCIYDTRPVAPEKPRGVSLDRPADEPGRVALLRGAISENASRLLVKVPRFIGSHAIPLAAALAAGLKERLGASKTPPWKTIRPTSLNIGRPSQRRLISYKSLSLTQVKNLARHFDCKVNDIGLLLYSCAMEEYFKGVGEAVDFDLTCAMPLNTRSEESSEGGNQVTVGFISLNNTIDNLEERLAAIKRETKEMKTQSRPEESLVAMGEIDELVPSFALDLLLYLDHRFSLSGKSLANRPLLNAVVSNVPGSPQRLFVANAELVDTIPVIPAALGIAVTGGIGSVANAITISFHCDAEAVRDKALFVKGVERGFRALRTAAEPVRKPRKR